MLYRSRCLSFAIALLFAAVSTSGCAVLETRQTKLQAVKTVGIISAVGDEFTFEKGGLSGLNERSQSFPVGSWGLDDMIVQQATLAMNGRFQVQPVNYNRVAFAAIEKGPMEASVNFIRKDPFKKLVQSEVSPQGLDAYIVISKAKSKFGTGGRKLYGLGFITYGTVLASYHHIHALYEVRVINGRTFDIIEKRVAQPLDSAGAVRLAGPSRLVDESFSPRTGDPARNDKLHAAITDLVERSLSSTLNDMHLAEIP